MDVVRYIHIAGIKCCSVIKCFFFSFLFSFPRELYAILSIMTRHTSVVTYCIATFSFYFLESEINKLLLPTASRVNSVGVCCSSRLLARCLRTEALKAAFVTRRFIGWLTPDHKTTCATGFPIQSARGAPGQESHSYRALRGKHSGDICIANIKTRKEATFPS